MADTVYIVERFGKERLDNPEFVDVFASKGAAEAFVVSKNSTNKSCYNYIARRKKVRT